MLTDPMREKLLSLEARRFVLAYSGGIDSQVLLHVLTRLTLPAPLVAVHVNHGLSEFCDEWTDRCQLSCDALGVSLTSVSVSVSRSGSLEENARNARYEVFEDFVEEGDVLLFAHHSDDQLETAFLSLFRGGGQPGVTGMPLTRPMGDAVLFRPLLDQGRAEIEAYAEGQGLSWIEDDSNIDIGHARNYVRHKVVPVIEAHWPDLREAVLKAIDRDLDVSQLIDSIGETDLESTSQGAGLSVPGLRALPASRRRNLVRYWVAGKGLPLPSGAMLRNELDSLLDAAPDAAPLLSWQGVSLRRFNDAVYLTGPVLQPEVTVSDIALGEQELVGGIVSAEISKGRGLCVDIASVQVRFRVGGERLRLDRNRRLKNIFQELGIPPWLRDVLPLIYVDDELVATAALPDWQVPMVVASAFCSSKGQSGLEISFSMPNQPYSN